MSIERFKERHGVVRHFFVASWRCYNLSHPLRTRRAIQLVQLIHQRLLESLDHAITGNDLQYYAYASFFTGDEEEKILQGRHALDQFPGSEATLKDIRFLRVDGVFFGLTLAHGESKILRTKRDQTAVALTSFFRTPKVVRSVFCESKDGFPLKMLCGHDLIGKISADDFLTHAIDEALRGFADLTEVHELLPAMAHSLTGLHDVLPSPC
jgi:hypothetical protein